MSTEWTVLVRSGYFFVAVEVKVLMFPETKSRETSGLSEKQNELFP